MNNAGAITRRRFCILCIILPAIGANAPSLSAAAFTLTEQSRVQNDRAEITLTAEVERDSKDAALQDAQGLTDWASAYRSGYPEIGVAVMNQQPAVRCTNDCEERTWVVRASVMLSGAKIERLGHLAALLLERFTLERIRFNLSPLMRAKTEHLLISRATRRFSREAPGDGTYDAIEITSENTAQALPDITDSMAQPLNPGYSIIAVKLLQY